MLKLFSRAPAGHAATAKKDDVDNIGLQKVLPATELLGPPHRRRLIKALWDSTSLTADVFNRYLKAPIERYASLVQSLPASENHHHSYPGGLLDHALESAVYGLKLRQSHLLPPGDPPRGSEQCRGSMERSHRLWRTDA